MWDSRELLHHGYRWLIGDGQSIRVWTDQWLKDEVNKRIQTLMVQGMEELRVCDLWMSGTREWDEGLLEIFFEPEDVDAILSITSIAEQIL
ncbi:hypothetical protein LINPERPRIM_LOCUS21521 [Linum perenne]